MADKTDNKTTPYVQKIVRLNAKNTPVDLTGKLGPQPELEEAA
jgi:hypothetical protein